MTEEGKGISVLRTSAMRDRNLLLRVLYGYFKMGIIIKCQKKEDQKIKNEEKIKDNLREDQKTEVLVFVSKQQ